MDTCRGPILDTKLEVYSGSCGNQTLVVRNNNALECGTRQSAVAWLSESGETYRIRVHGQPGAFLLESKKTPFNDVCFGSVSVDELLTEPNKTIEGTTIGATATGEGSLFGGTDTIRCQLQPYNGSPGVWYSFNGRLGELSLRVCGESEFSPLVTVFVGGNDCSSLSCSSQTTADACIEGVQLVGMETTYYLLVRGSSDTGDFIISREDEGI